jgi:predicted transcriptional regulator
MAGRVPPALAREREVQAWDLACAGRSQDYIAQQLGVTQPAVSQILRRVTTRHLKRLEAEVDERKAVHTARLEYIVAEALEAWEKSKEARKRSSRKKTVIPGELGPQTPEALAAAPDGQPIARRPDITAKEERFDQAETTAGEVAYLQMALTADAELRKLHGIYAPKKLDILDKRRPLEKLTDDELAQRARENAAELAAGGDQA